MENQNNNNVVHLPSQLDLQPMDYTISIHMRNLFATYGESVVRESLLVLFNMKTDPEAFKRINGI